MSSTKNLWQAWNLSRTWRVRASELYHITDPLTAFYFDRVVAAFGQEVEAALDEASDGAKNRREIERKRGMVLARYLKEADGSTPRGTYADPAAR